MEQNKEIQKYVYRPCIVCGEETNVIVGINLKAVHVCQKCCTTITKQTVMSDL